MKLKALTLSFSALLIQYFVWGQKVNLTQYLELLKKQNLELKISNNEISSSKEDIRSALSLLLPNISANANYQRDFNKNFLFINNGDEAFGTTKFQTNFNNNINANVIAEQPLFDLTAFSDYKIARLTEEYAALNRDKLSIDMVEQAALLYWRAIYVRESLQVLKENAELAKKQWEQVRELHQKGVVSKLKEKQAENLYKKSIPEITTTENQYKSLMSELKLLANLPQSTSLELTDRLTGLNLIQVPTQLKTNSGQNIQLKIVEKQIQLSNQTIESRKAAWLPTAKAAVGYNFATQDQKFKFTNKNKLFYGMVSISLPLFAGGNKSAQLQKAKIQRETALLKKEQIQSTLAQKLHNAQLNKDNAIQKITLEKESIQLSEKELAISKKSLELGTITLLEYKEARIGLTKSKLALINAYLEYQIAKIRIENIVGNTAN